MTQSDIALTDVHLSLGQGAGRVHILRGLDVSIGRGEAIGLIGPSGSGKSTLLSVVAGLESPDKGQVMVAGRDIAGLGEDALARFRLDHIGIVFQSFHLIPNMTALENVSVPLEFAGIGNAFEKSGKILGTVGLGDRMNHYPTELSGGEQQRVALARALVGEPRILLADEPTGNLDGETGEQIIDLLFALQREHGATLLLVTHDTQLAERCNTVLEMANGTLRPMVRAKAKKVAAASGMRA